MSETPETTRAEEQSKKLTSMQRRFIDAYLTTWNATAAAKAAGYSPKTAAAIGWENLRKPEIARAIAAELEANHMTVEEALSRLADMARGNMEDFIKNGRIDLKKSPDKLHLLRKVAKGRHGLTIEMHDQQSAIEKILQAAGKLEAQKPAIVIENANIYINEVLEKIHGEKIDGE